MFSDAEKKRLNELAGTQKLSEEKSYYEIDAEDPPSIEKIIKKWASKESQLLDEIVHAYYKPDSIEPYLEYHWTRETSRGGKVRVGGDWKEFTSGEKKWDALKREMKENGWPDNMPLRLQVGRDGCAKVGEGNHRFAIAKSIGIDRIPVRFLFQQKVTDPSQCI